MVPRLFRKLFDTEDVVTRPGVDVALANAIGPLLGIALPADHLDFLKSTNGAEGFGGYIRLFGFGPKSATNLVEWNSESCWKFAWSGRLAPYFCFGETGWGDQFAYHVDQLSAGDTSVYFLDALAMQPQKIAADFGGFFTKEFIPGCHLPYDDMTMAARQAVGDLSTGEHVAYNPSPVIGGPEVIESVVKLPSRSAMIIAGDLALGMDALDSDASDFRLEQYADAEGRVRIKIFAC